MGCCCSSSNTLSYEKVNRPTHSEAQALTTAIVLDDTNTWSPITSAERAEIANALHLCPFPDGRKNSLFALRSRLLSCADLASFMDHLPADYEKLQAIETLNGNLTDRAAHFQLLLKTFSDDEIRQKASAILCPRRLTSQDES